MSTTYERTVNVPKEDRYVYIERQPTSYDRTVYVTE
jgi:hypothetical protein